MSAVSNTLGKVRIFAEPGKPVQPGDLDEGARRMPGGGRARRERLARTEFGGAGAVGARARARRDVFEILAVEIIPMMRRMMIAAAMMAARRSPGDVAFELGLPPQSGLATRAIEGARRYGLARLNALIGARVRWTLDSRTAPSKAAKKRSPD